MLIKVLDFARFFAKTNQKSQQLKEKKWQILEI